MQILRVSAVFTSPDCSVVHRIPLLVVSIPAPIASTSVRGLCATRTISRLVLVRLVYVMRSLLTIHALTCKFLGMDFAEMGGRGSSSGGYLFWPRRLPRPPIGMRVSGPACPIADCSDGPYAYSLRAQGSPAHARSRALRLRAFSDLEDPPRLACARTSRSRHSALPRCKPRRT